MMSLIIGDRWQLVLSYATITPPQTQTKSLHYAYYDAGEMWNYQYVGGTPLKASGTSTGLGVRFAFTQYVSGNLMWTQVLTKQIAAEELIGDGKRPRVFFSVLASV